MTSYAIQGQKPTNLTETSAVAYNNVNDLVNQWNDKNPNQYVQGATGSWQDLYQKDKSMGRKATTVVDHYGINANTGNKVVDQYGNYLLGGGTQGATKWLEGERAKYKTDMENAAKSAVSGYIDPYISGQQGYVDNALEAAFQESLDKLKRQKAYGYLSQIGYDKAEKKLNEQKGSVQANMNDAYSGLVHTGEKSWLTNLNNMYNTAIGRIGEWDFVNPFDAEGSDYYKQNQLAQNYAQNSINEDIIKSILANANTFTPEEWIAYGAGEQGQYNPFADFTAGTRKKKTTSTSGINEV